MRKRERKVTIRMTSQEYQTYQVRLKQSNLSGNTFGLHCLLNHKINVIEELPELIRQLKGIGNNLNQLARAANQGQATPVPAVTALDEGVKKLWLWLRRAAGADH